MIVLDTHVLVWWLDNPRRLSPKAAKKINPEVKKGEILVSSITVWELFMLARKGRLSLKIDVNDWVSMLEKLSFVRFVPVDNRIARRSVDLPGKFHEDPADRIIVATTMETGGLLLTSDKNILNYPNIKTVW